MLYLKNLLNKSVVDETTSCDTGRLTAITLDKQSGKCLLVTENDCITAEITAVKKDRIIVSQTETQSPTVTVEIGMEAYDTAGKSVGAVTDVAFSKRLKFGRLITESGEEYSRSKIYAAGDIILVRLPTKRKQTTKKVAQRNATELAQPTTAIEQQANVAAELKAQYPKKRKYGDFSFLIGKTVDKNITNFYGELMLRVGDKVTPDKLKQAKRSGKLIELCLHAK